MAAVVMTDDLVARLRNIAPEEDDQPLTRKLILEATDELERLREAAKGQLVVVNAAEARVRELEAERDKWDRRVAYDELQAREHENRATQQHQIDALTIRAEAAERALAEAYERAADKADELSGCSNGYIATVLRDLAQEVKHETE